MSLLVKLNQENAKTPTRGTPGACGLDLYSVGETELGHGDRALVPTGISVKLPPGTYGRIAPRSGLALKYGIDIMAGVIDEDYRGEIMVLMINFGTESFKIKAGDRIAQFIVEKYLNCPIVTVSSLDETDRGSGGFGSTDINIETQEKLFREQLLKSGC
jgi:dUTP pyrophosphatase